MENNSTYNLLPVVEQVKFLASVILDEDVSEQKILEVTQLVLPKIGNKHYELFVYKGKADSKGILDLPCNVEIIEAVGTVYPETGYESIFTPGNTFSILGKNVYRVRERNQTYFKGDFLNYSFTGDKLVLNQDYTNNFRNTPSPNSGREIVIMYYGKIVDSKGRPLVTEKEAEAIVYYMAYLKEKRMLYKRQGDNGQGAQIAQMDYRQKFSQARVPAHISQNALQDLKQVVQSRNQWGYNRHYRKRN